MKNNKFRITIIFQILFFYNNIFAQNYADSLSFYYQKKDFNKSIYFGEKWLFDLKKANDTVSLNYADCLFFNANSQQDNPNTETYYLESLSLYKKILGNNNEYSNYLYIVSNYFLNNKKDFFKAEYFFKELINIRGRNLGTKNKDYIEALFMLGFTYYQKEDFNSALQIFSTVANLRKENFGENNTDYLKALNFVGLAYQNLKDLSLAEKVFLDVYEINKKLKGENDMSNLGYANKTSSIS